jgi:hypothetical protein
MNTKIKNILITIGGMLLGMAANMSTLIMGIKAFPLPEGVDPMNTTSYIAHLDQFTTINYMVPIISHAFGTFVSALFICKLVSSKEKYYALFVGIFFLAGGISMALQVQSPLWVTITDLILAYIPVAFIGYYLGIKNKVAK